MLPEELLKNIMEYLSYRCFIKLWSTSKTLRETKVPYLRFSRVIQRLCAKSSTLFFKSPISLWDSRLWETIHRNDESRVFDIRYCKPTGTAVHTSWNKEKTRLIIRLDRFPPSWLQRQLPFNAIVEIEVVGVWFHVGVPMFEEITGREQVMVQHEPLNPYDKNAHAVYLDGLKTGYLFKKSVSRYIAFLSRCPDARWKTKRLILRQGFIPRIILFSEIQV